ncbi:MAG: LytR/AlgR family response regulator transcription factor [Candidatus Coproplasma sp.]
MYNIALIEDDVNFVTSLKQALNRFAEENGHTFIISSFVSVEDFLLPRQDKYDIVIFDIELPGMNGMDGAKRFRLTDSDAVIIFLTSLSRYAVNGYEVEALDYMVKPVTYNNLSLKLNKAIKKCESRQYKTIVLHGREGVSVVRSIDVYYLEVRGHSLTFHTEKGNVEATGSLSDYEEDLKDYNFSRCNSCYIVNMQAISRIDGTTIWLRNGEQIIISRRKKKEFFSDFTQYIGK